MAVAREIMGFSLTVKSPFLAASSTRLMLSQRKNTFFLPCDGRRRVQLMRQGVKSTTPVAAISEDLDLVKVVPEKAVKFKVRAVVTVRNKNKEDLKEALVKHLDAFTDKIGRNVVLELVSTDIDPKTKAPKKSSEAVLKDWSKKSNLKTERVNYTAEFVVDSSFGIPGAIAVTNKHQQEFFLESITIEGFACGPVHFPCNSWVQPKKDHPGKRVFFSNQVFDRIFSENLGVN
jgi:lipoxygenase